MVSLNLIFFIIMYVSLSFRDFFLLGCEDANSQILCFLAICRYAVKLSNRVEPIHLPRIPVLYLRIKDFKKIFSADRLGSRLVDFKEFSGVASNLLINI